MTGKVERLGLCDIPVLLSTKALGKQHRHPGPVLHNVSRRNFSVGKKEIKTKSKQTSEVPGSQLVPLVAQSCGGRRELGRHHGDQTPG